jgi:hypothetical protein
MRSLNSIFVACLAPILASCSIHPLIDDVTRTTTFDIVEKIRCEAKEAVRKHGRGLTTNATIAYEFTFDILETNNASGSATWSIPFLSGGDFSLTANANADRMRHAIRNFKIVDTFDELRAAKCDPIELEKNWAYPIAGDIGIYEVIETFTKLAAAEHPVEKEFFAFHDTLTFTTDIGGDVIPTLNLKPVTKQFRVTSASGNLTTSRKDVHTLVLALVAHPAPATIARRGRAIRAYNPRNAGANSNLTTTLLQTAGDPRRSALYELDRARIRALQDRILTQTVGP